MLHDEKHPSKTLSLGLAGWLQHNLLALLKPPRGSLVLHRPQQEDRTPSVRHCWGMHGPDVMSTVNFDYGSRALHEGWPCENHTSFFWGAAHDGTSAALLQCGAQGFLPNVASSVLRRWKSCANCPLGSVPRARLIATADSSCFEGVRSRFNGFGWRPVLQA